MCARAIVEDDSSVFVVRPTILVSAASAPRPSVVGQAGNPEALGSCKPVLGGWRNQPSIGKSARVQASSSQDCLVWSSRRSRRQDREGNPDSRTLGRHQVTMTSLATTFQQAKTRRTATSRRNLTTITSLDTSHQQTKTAPSQHPIPARPASRGSRHQQQPRDYAASQHQPPRRRR
jgi:hypothetical protein